MAEMKHTDWRYNTPNFDGVIWRTVPTGQNTAKIETVARDVSVDHAPLIAAAPDLLDALEQFVRIRDWNHDEPHSARLEYDAAADAARAIISKATSNNLKDGRE